jgi:hypothetical protein
MDEYLALISQLQSGVTQLVVHCGYATAGLRQLTGRRIFDAESRQLDLEAITSPWFKKALCDREITLTSWRSAPFKGSHGSPAFA